MENFRVSICFAVKVLLVNFFKISGKTCMSGRVNYYKKVWFEEVSQSFKQSKNHKKLAKQWSLDLEFRIMF